MRNLPPSTAGRSGSSSCTTTLAPVLASASATCAASPSARSRSTGTSSVPSSTMRLAVSGRSFASSFSAPRAWEIDRISIQCPTSMMSIRVTSSQKNTLPCTPNTTALE